MTILVFAPASARALVVRVNDGQAIACAANRLATLGDGRDGLRLWFRPFFIVFIEFVFPVFVFVLILIFLSHPQRSDRGREHGEADVTVHVKERQVEPREVVG